MPCHQYLGKQQLPEHCESYNVSHQALGKQMILRTWHGSYAVVYIDHSELKLPRVRESTNQKMAYTLEEA